MPDRFSCRFSLRRHRGTDTAIDLPRGHAENPRRQRRHRQQQHQFHRQRWIERQHDRDGDEERHEFAQQHAEARQQLEQRLDVVGEARHHTADRDPVIEARRQALQMGEEIAPQVAQPVEHGARQHHPEAVAEGRPEQYPEPVEKAGGDDRMQREEIGEQRVERLLAEIRRAFIGCWQQDAVDNDSADDDRRQNRGARRQQHKGQRDIALPAIGREPMHQPADKSEVEAARLHLVVEDGVVAVSFRHLCRLAHVSLPVRLPRLCTSSSRRPCWRSSVA